MERAKTWPHLENEILDERFRIVARNVDVGGKDVLDFNCGLGRGATILKGYKSYWGNDIEEGFIEKCPHELGSFHVLDDTKVLGVVGNVDVLLYFGACLGEHPSESQTATKSFFKIVQLKQPEIVVLESCREYLQEKGLGKRMTSGLIGYGKKMEECIDVGEEAYLKRKVVIYERLI